MLMVVCAEDAMPLRNMASVWLEVEVGSATLETNPVSLLLMLGGCYFFLGRVKRFFNLNRLNRISSWGLNLWLFRLLLYLLWAKGRSHIAALLSGDGWQRLSHYLWLLRRFLWRLIWRRLMRLIAIPSLEYLQLMLFEAFLHVTEGFSVTALLL